MRRESIEKIVEGIISADETHIAGVGDDGNVDGLGNGVGGIGTIAGRPIDEEGFAKQITAGNDALAGAEVVKWRIDIIP